jgi:hypothetical protein
MDDLLFTFPNEPTPMVLPSLKLPISEKQSTQIMRDRQKMGDAGISHQ